MSKNG